MWHSKNNHVTEWRSDKKQSVTFYSHSVYIIFYVSLNRLINWLTNWLVLIGKHLLVCILLPNAYICRSRVFVAKRYLYKAMGWNVDWNENCFGSSLMLMDPRAVQMSQKRFQIFPFALTFLYQKICKNYPLRSSGNLSEKSEDSTTRRPWVNWKLGTETGKQQCAG